MPAQQILSDYQGKISAIQSPIQNAFSTDGDGNYIFHKPFRDFVTEAAVVKIYITWESFLEECFIIYSMCEPSCSGMLYVRYSTPLNSDHARSIALGTRDFVEWGSPDIVIRLCKLYFDNGEPFKSVLSGIYSDLLNLKNIRKAAAHLSSTTRKKLDAVAAALFGIPSPGIAVSDLVVAIHPNGLPNETVLEYYMRMLDADVTSILR